MILVLRSAQHPQIPRFLQIFRGIWPMPLSLLNHSALALFAQRTRIPTSARSIGFCAIWVCISSSSSSHWPNSSKNLQKARDLWVLRTPQNNKEEGARAKKLVTCGARSPLGRGQSVPFSAQGAYCSAPEPSKALTGQELLPRSRSGSE